MPVRRTLALAGATIALVLVPSAAALAAPTSVSVRVEGITHTLLSPTIVHTHAGSITKGGTPAGACPASSGAGALDVASHHRFNGSYGSLGLSITQILGESHSFTSPDYWSVWVDNRFATAGVCGLRLHRGEQLLFAAVSQKGSAYPIVVTGPSRATTGHSFKLKVVYDNGKGAPKPLARARVGGALSDKHGIVQLTAAHRGELTLVASESGYIRSAPLRVHVS